MRKGKSTEQRAIWTQTTGRLAGRIQVNVLRCESKCKGARPASPAVVEGNTLIPVPFSHVRDRFKKHRSYPPCSRCRKYLCRNNQMPEWALQVRIVGLRVHSRANFGRNVAIGVVALTRPRACITKFQESEVKGGGISRGNKNLICSLQ